MNKTLIGGLAALAIGVSGATIADKKKENDLYEIMDNTPMIIAENCVSQRPDCAKISGTLTPLHHKDGKTYLITNKHVVAPLTYQGEVAKTKYTIHNTELAPEGLELKLLSISLNSDLALLEYDGELPTLEEYRRCEPKFNDITHTFGFGHGKYKLHDQGIIASDFVYKDNGAEYYAISNDIVPGMSGGPLFIEDPLGVCLGGITSMTMDYVYGFAIPIQEAEKLYEETQELISND